MGGSIKDPKRAPEFWGLTVRIIQCVLALALIFMVIVVSLRILSDVAPPPQFLLSDLAALLFGSASLALFIFSSLVAMIAVLGWNNIIKHVQEKVEASAEKKLQAVAVELQGRSYSNLGFMLGELSLQPGKFTLGDKDRLGLAVNLCEEGYKLLRSSAPSVQLMGLNNVVFYKAQQRNPADFRFLLEKARELRKAGEERQASRFLLTYCRVVIVFRSQVSGSEVEDARAIIRGLLDRAIDPYERKEAEYYHGLLNHPTAVS